jgi:glycosyltransferase involved in cell wall biosynthesis
MNIVILVAGLPPERVGGAEIQASHVAHYLSSQHTVTVLTRTARVLPELASSPCVVVQRCRVTVPGLRFVADLVQTLTLIGRSRNSIDAIVAYQTTIDGLIGVVAKMLFGIPVIVSIRSDIEYQVERHRQSRLFSPFVFRHADRLAVQSETLGHELVAAFERGRRRPSPEQLRAKLFVLPNGISTRVPPAGKRDGVVYVGRLTKSKNVSALIDAMRRCPGERLTVVGDGPERQHLEKAARGAPNVVFRGLVDQGGVQEILSRAKLLVLPSRQEGQPNVIMEAMSFGVPVIATRVGGIPDLISHGKSGWLVKPDDVGGLADAIRTLASDAPLRERLAANASLEVQKYAWPVVVDALERQLLKVVRQRDGEGQVPRGEA